MKNYYKIIKILLSLDCGNKLILSASQQIEKITTYSNVHKIETQRLSLYKLNKIIENGRRLIRKENIAKLIKYLDVVNT